MTIPRLTRGATLRHRFVLPVAVEAYTAFRAQAVVAGARVDLDVHPVDGTSHVYVTAPGAVTATWPLRLIPVSLRVEILSDVAHTETIFFHILPEVTQNG